MGWVVATSTGWARVRPVSLFASSATACDFAPGVHTGSRRARSPNLRFASRASRSARPPADDPFPDAPHLADTDLSVWQRQLPSRREFSPAPGQHPAVPRPLPARSAPVAAGCRGTCPAPATSSSHVLARHQPHGLRPARTGTARRSLEGLEARLVPRSATSTAPSPMSPPSAPRCWWAGTGRGTCWPTAARSICIRGPSGGPVRADDAGPDPGGAVAPDDGQPDFQVLVRLSFAVYLADWLLDAASEYLTG